jgi:hypothetical protein
VGSNQGNHKENSRARVKKGRDRRAPDRRAPDRRAPDRRAPVKREIKREITKKVRLKAMAIRKETASRGVAGLEGHHLTANHREASSKGVLRVVAIRPRSHRTTATASHATASVGAGRVT